MTADNRTAAIARAKTIRLLATKQIQSDIIRNCKIETISTKEEIIASTYKVHGI